MKQQSEHKIIVRQENETTDRTQDHRKTAKWNNGQNTRPPLTVVLCSVRCFILLSYGGLVFCPLFHFAVLRWSCVLTVVSFSCLTMVLCSDCCFILLSYDDLVFWLLFHSPVLRWSCVLTDVLFSCLKHKIIVRQENKTTDRTQDHRKTGEWNNGQNTRPPQNRGMKQPSEHKTTVRQENETIDRTQDHCKTGEWNNSQNTRS
jgi:hypothetical protein